MLPRKVFALAFQICKYLCSPRQNSPTKTAITKYSADKIAHDRIANNKNTSCMVAYYEYYVVFYHLV